MFASFDCLQRIQKTRKLLFDICLLWCWLSKIFSFLKNQIQIVPIPIWFIIKGTIQFLIFLDSAELYSDSVHPYMEDNYWWKMTYDGRCPLLEDVLDGGWPLMEYDHRWKITFNGRQPLMEDIDGGHSLMGNDLGW